MMEYCQELIQEPVRVELEHIGEGYNGDYDPDDPNDRQLLRFTVSVRDEDGEWQQVDDASYCTELTVNLSAEKAQQVLTFIMSEVYDDVVGGNSIKKRCEMLSWVPEPL